MNYKSLCVYLLALVLTLLVLFFPYLFFNQEKDSEIADLRVMAYSSFIQKWGAGPEVAKLFFQETGLKVHWINAGNAGLLLERLKFKKETDKPDMVIGFDQFSVHEAEKDFDWKALQSPIADGESSLPFSPRIHNFLAYDWGPMTFLYKGDLQDPPVELGDLSHSRYKNKIILQDPRMSSPGLQFLFWVISEMGEEEGFTFLKRLKPSITIMSPSWSSSYSLFKMEKSSFVFSYFTSPFYHLIEEGDDTYKAVQFERPHPVQVEYFGVPQFCHACENAQKFASFLLTDRVQKILMNRNYMYPISAQALFGSQIKMPEGVRYYDPMESLSLIKRKKQLVKRWKKIFY